MFSKYDEISKLIRNYIEASLVKPMMDVTMLNKHLVERYGISLSNMDATNLTNRIAAVKKLRSEFALKNQNSFKQDEAVLNELKRQESFIVEEEGRVREFGYILANKICIMIYKGPLTIDTMKELKEHHYDGTYGNTTMMQMYALYNEKQRLETDNEKLKSDIAKKDALVDAFRQQYTEQYHNLHEYKIRNENLSHENENLKEAQQQIRQCISDQGLALQLLNQNVVSFMQSYAVNMNSFSTTPVENKGVELQKAA
jgi:hypothetical protein